MFVKDHEEYTEQILKGVSVSKENREQILKGAIANDLCEFTNEGYQIIKNRSGLFDFLDPKRYSFLYQSHRGRLTSLHAMSWEYGEAAENTMKEVYWWFEFLNDIAIGKSIDPRMNISDDKQNKIYELFSDLYVTYEDMFDSKDMSEIQYRAIGMMLHLIQDSFTPSHCRRDDNNMNITKFYYFKKQSKHGSGDTVAVSSHRESVMLSACADCIQCLLRNVRYDDYKRSLELGAITEPSDGGEYS